MKYRVFWCGAMDDELYVGPDGKVFFVEQWGDKIIEYVDNATVMFCTGLQDAAGTYIYDGDILQGEHGTTGKPTYVQIQWGINEGWWANYDLRGNFHGTLRELLKSQMGHTYTVAGNIHENPELLPAREV